MAAARQYCRVTPNDKFFDLVETVEQILWSPLSSIRWFFADIIPAFPAVQHPVGTACQADISSSPAMITTGPNGQPGCDMLVQKLLGPARRSDNRNRQVSPETADIARFPGNQILNASSEFGNPAYEPIGHQSDGQSVVPGAV